MNVMWSLSWFVLGLVGGVGVSHPGRLAIRAAIEGRAGVTFGDLWTALAVGTAVGFVPLLLGKLMWWRMRRTRGVDFEGGSLSQIVLPGYQRTRRSRERHRIVRSAWIASTSSRTARARS